MSIQLFFNLVNLKRFPILIIQEPIIIESNYIYILRNFWPVRTLKYSQQVIILIYNKIPLVDQELKRATNIIEQIRILLGREQINIINVYYRIGERYQEQVYRQEEIKRYLKKVKEEEILLLEDFNYYYLVQSGKKVVKKRRAEYLLAIIKR